jgi:hypothetical protein
METRVYKVWTKATGIEASVTITSTSGLEARIEYAKRHGLGDTREVMSRWVEAPFGWDEVTA